jgi:hypothetical protein
VATWFHNIKDVMSAYNIPWHPNRRNALTKDQLLNGLNNILNNFLYGFMCSRLVTPEAWRKASRGAVLFKGRERAVQIELGPLAKRAINPTVGFTRNYENSLLRTMVRESHELILLYCHETKQFQVYKAESWFQFARILRNIISHKEGGTLREWPKDLLRKGITSVAWHNRTFDTTMLGTGLTFYPPEGLELLKDQIDFVVSKLS